MKKKLPRLLSSLRVSRDLAKLISRNFKKNTPLKGLHPHHAALKGFTLGCTEMAMKNGICETFYQDGELKGCLLVSKVQMTEGLSLYWGFIETDQSSESSTWALGLLEENKDFFKNDSMIEIPYYLHGLLKSLYKKGFHVDTVRLVGTPKQAHNNLNQNRTFMDPQELGLKITKLKSDTELNQIREIQKTEFRRNPQYGWFVGSEAWLNHSLKVRKSEIKNPQSQQFLYKKGTSTKGYFGYVPYHGYLSGKMVGTDLIFNKELQGHGLSTVSYKMMLEQMIKDDVQFFTGNTSQLPVIKLAKRMGRVPLSYMIRLGRGHFKESHFTL